MSHVLPAGATYGGRVHEQPISDLPRIRLPVVVGHDGDLPELMKAKEGCNQYLLRLALANDPEDACQTPCLGEEVSLPRTTWRPSMRPWGTLS
jgi:hypothetical protein